MRSSGARAAEAAPRSSAGDGTAETPREATPERPTETPERLADAFGTSGNFISFDDAGPRPGDVARTAFLAFPGDAAAVAVVVAPETKFPYRSRAFGESAPRVSTARVSALSQNLGVSAAVAAPPLPALGGVVFGTTAMLGWSAGALRRGAPPGTLPKDWSTVCEAARRAGAEAAPSLCLRDEKRGRGGKRQAGRGKR